MEDLETNLECPIYVINLKHRVDRRERMEKNLAGMKRDGVKFIEAVYGTEVNLDEFPKIGPMKRGEVGCFLSHIKVINEFLETKAEYALILEDDVDLVLPRQSGEIKRIISTITEIFGNWWDIIYLHINNMNQITLIHDNRLLGVAPDEVLGAHSYIISRQMATRVINYYNLHGIDEVYDLLISNRNKFPHIVNLVSMPGICHPYDIKDSDTCRSKW
jgi:glycosyl transferase family 25